MALPQETGSPDESTNSMERIGEQSCSSECKCKGGAHQMFDGMPRKDIVPLPSEIPDFRSMVVKEDATRFMFGSQNDNQETEKKVGNQDLENIESRMHESQETRNIEVYEELETSGFDNQIYSKVYKMVAVNQTEEINNTDDKMEQPTKPMRTSLSEAYSALSTDSDQNSFNSEIVTIGQIQSGDGVLNGIENQGDHRDQEEFGGALKVFDRMPKRTMDDLGEKQGANSEGGMNSSPQDEFKPMVQWQQSEDRNILGKPPEASDREFVDHGRYGRTVPIETEFAPKVFVKMPPSGTEISESQESSKWSFFGGGNFNGGEIMALTGSVEQDSSKACKVMNELITQEEMALGVTKIPCFDPGGYFHNSSKFASSASLFELHGLLDGLNEKNESLTVHENSKSISSYETKSLVQCAKLNDIGNDMGFLAIALPYDRGKLTFIIGEAGSNQFWIRERDQRVPIQPFSSSFDAFNIASYVKIHIFDPGGSWVLLFVNLGYAKSGSKFSFKVQRLIFDPGGEKLMGGLHK